jgi:anti-sigma factor RsiW
MSSIRHRLRVARDHRWTPPRMSAYLDGELAPSDRIRVERHVRECDECRHVLAGLRAVLAALGRVSGPGGAPDAVEFAALVRARLPAR